MGPPAPAPEPVTGRQVAGGVAAAAGLIAGLTLLARAAGFVRTLVFADSVGAVGVGNAYQSVNALPNVFYEVAAGGVLAAVAIPLVAGHLGRGDTGAARRATSALLTWAVTILVPVAVVIWWVAPTLSRWILPADDAAAVRVGTDMLRIFAPQVVLYGIGIVLAGHLQAHRRFLAAAVAPLLSSLVVIGTYAAYGVLRDGRTAPAAVPTEAVVLLAGGTTLGVVALSLPLFGPAFASGWRWRPTWSFPAGDTRRVGHLAAAGVLALAAQSAAVLVTNWLANQRGGDGTFVVYGYAQAVYLLPYAVLAVPVATSAFPAIAQRAAAAGAAAGDPQPGRPQAAPERTVADALRAVMVLGGLAAAVLVAVAPLVGPFFGALDTTSTAAGGPLGALPGALTAYAPGLVGFCVAALLTRALYVRGRPVLAGAAVAAGWAVAALVPVTLLGAGAGPRRTLTVLGIGSSLGMSLSAVALVVLTHRAWGPAALAGGARSAVAVLLGAPLAAFVGRLVADRPDRPGVVLAVAWGVLVMMVVTVVLGVVIAAVDREILHQVTRRVRRREREVVS